MTRFRKASAALALTAALSMAATPGMAAQLPAVAAPDTAPVGVHQWDGDAVKAERHRRWRHHRNRIDAGDVLAGVLIIGGIAAIADAASRPKRDDRYRETRYPERNNSSRRSTSGDGLDRAVDMCLGQIERDVRVDTVDNVARTGEGWSVTGTIYNGDSFSCQIDNRGRVSDITYGSDFAAAEDRQWNDERYRAARAQVDQQDYPVDTAMVQDEPVGPQPAYPGGPIDGDLAEDGELGG